MKLVPCSRRKFCEGDIEVPKMSLCAPLAELDKFSECQDNMSFPVQKWPDISNYWSDIPSKNEAEKKE